MKLRVGVALVGSLCLLSGCGGGGSSSGSKSNSTLLPQPLVITSAALPNGTAGTPYGGNSKGFSFTASGGITPYETAIFETIEVKDATVPGHRGLCDDPPTFAYRFGQFTDGEMAERCATGRAVNNRDARCLEPEGYGRTPEQPRAA